MMERMDEQQSDPSNRLLVGRARATSVPTETNLETGKESKRSFCSNSLLVLLLKGASVAFCCLMLLLLTNVAEDANVHDERLRRRATLTTQRSSLPPWKPGMLDIHHLHVGPSEVRE